MAIQEPGGGEIASRLQSMLPEHSRGISIFQENGCPACSKTCDLFIVLRTQGESKLREVKTKVLLAPGNVSPEILRGISSEWVVSYGLSGKDTITVSSLEPGFALLTLQRELVTLAGRVIEQQEIPLPFPKHLSAQELMVLYGSLIILGTPPESLGEKTPSP